VETQGRAAGRPRPGCPRLGEPHPAATRAPTMWVRHLAAIGG